MIDITGNYIHLFETQSEYETERTTNYKEPWVSYTKATSAVTYNKTEREKLLEIPLTFEVIGDGNITWKAQDTAYIRTIEYKKNDGEWISITSSTGGTNISVVVGDIVQFRGDNAAYSSGSSRYNSFSGTTCQFKAKGNIMSLINGTDFATATTLQSAYTFFCLFRGRTGLTDASELLLPATTLAERCYCYMFDGCFSLTTVPELPATTLANYCYGEMFAGCTSLTIAPELPATTLADRCYYGMFAGCTSLTTAHELPATTLTNSCYSSMFQGCTSLTTAPSSIGNSATIMTNYCCQYMFQGCTNLITAPELPATTLAEGCYRTMFVGCTSLTTAPELPATTLMEYCYTGMFDGCTNLNYIKCLATNIGSPVHNYTGGWVNGVANSGTFVKDPIITGWESGINGIPENWTVQDA